MLIRPPDEVIGDNYLRRWFLIPHNSKFNVYLHNFRGSDDDRALHDHPWDSLGIILKGEYLEHTPEGVNHKKAGSFSFRKGKDSHRIELIENKPVWTLFITGPKYREWGFHCKTGWVHWKTFCK